MRLVWVLLLMARLHSCGFELNSVTDGMECADWNGAGATIVNSSLRGDGEYCMKILNPATGTRTGCAIKYVSSALDRYFIRFDFKLTTAPNVLTTIAVAGNQAAVGTTGAENVRIRLKTDGALEVFDVGAAAVLHTTSALSTGVTYCLEYFVSSQEGGGSNQVKFRIDASEVLSSTNRSYSTDEHTLKLGANLNGEACTTGEWYFDNVAINSEAGTAQNSWPGEGAILHLYPNAAGDFTEGTSGTGGTGYDDIDESPTPDDDTSYWKLVDPSSSSTDADRLDVNVEAFPGSADSITLVQVGHRVMPDTLSPMSVVDRIKGQASGTLLESATVSITGAVYVTHDDTAGTQQYKLTAYTNPQDGAAWTSTTLGTMQIGMRAPDATPDVRVTSLWALVDYVPSSAADYAKVHRLFDGATIPGTIWALGQ